MSGIRISELPKLTEITVDDYVIVNDANINTKSIRFSDFVSSINDVGGLIVTTKDVRLAANAVEEQTALNRLREFSSPIFDQSEANIVIAVALHDLNMRVSDFESIDVTEFRDTLIEYKDKTDILENQVNNINSQIDAHGDQITDINNQLTNQGQQITEITNQLGDQGGDLVDRVAELETNSVRRTGDVMTGGLKIKNDNNYKLELLPEATNRDAGTLLFSQNDETRGEIYWDPAGGHIDFSFPDVSRGGDQVILEIGKPAISIYTKTDIQGDLFVHDIDVLAEISKVKLELAAELLGLTVALKTKYNKEGGDVFGPLQVKPGGPTSTTLFSVSPTGPETIAQPSGNFSLTNKKYVDDKFADAGSVKSVAGKEGEVILVKADIVDFEDSDYATAAQGEKADTALQPNDNVSELTNDAGYLVQSDLDGLSNALVFKGSIDATTDYPASVSTGDVWANTTTGTADAQWTGLTNVTSGDLIAKGENQWVIVGASTVPDLSGYVEFGDNVSDLANDAGYVTEAEATGAAPVQSVAGKTGDVTLVKADITDLVEGDYATAAQGEKADTALQSGDNVSELTNDAEYVTKTYSDDEDDKIKDLLGDSIADINLQLGKYDHVFNYKVVEVFSQEDGEMTANSEDPTVNTMFVLDKIQSDGTVADFLSVAEENDILIIEQNINQRLRYKVIQVVDTGDQFAINCDFLDTDGTGTTEFIFDRLATVYIEKANSDKSDIATQDWANSNFLKKEGDTIQTGSLVTYDFKNGIKFGGWGPKFEVESSSVSINSEYCELALNTDVRLSSLNDGDITLDASGRVILKGYKIDCSNKRLENVAAPTADSHAANKSYVDGYSMPKNLNTLPPLP